MSKLDFLKGPESHQRSIVKAVTWRIIGTLDTFLLSLLVTGNAKYAVSIASVEALTKIILFYLHERVWRMVRWGQGAPSGQAADHASEPSSQPAS